MSTIFIVIIVLISVWLVYEFWRAPTYDEETMKVIRPTRTLKDIFKKNK